MRMPLQDDLCWWRAWHWLSSEHPGKLVQRQWDIPDVESEYKRLFWEWYNYFTNNIMWKICTADSKRGWHRCSAHQQQLLHVLLTGHWNAALPNFWRSCLFCWCDCSGSSSCWWFCALRFLKSYIFENVSSFLHPGFAQSLLQPVKECSPGYTVMLLFPANNYVIVICVTLQFWSSVVCFADCVHSNESVKCWKCNASTLVKSKSI